MNPETLEIAKLFVCVSGLAAIYFGGRVISIGLRSRRSSNHQDHSHVSYGRPANTTGSSQADGWDQRSTTFIPLSNRGQRPARKKRRN